MIKIIKPGSLEKLGVLKMICPKCGCEFTYTKADMKHERAPESSFHNPDYDGSLKDWLVIQCPFEPCGFKSYESN